MIVSSFKWQVSEHLNRFCVIKHSFYSFAIHSLFVFNEVNINWKRHIPIWLSYANFRKEWKFTFRVQKSFSFVERYKPIFRKNKSKIAISVQTINIYFYSSVPMIPHVETRHGIPAIPHCLGNLLMDHKWSKINWIMTVGSISTWFQLPYGGLEGLNLHFLQCA